MSQKKARVIADFNTDRTDPFVMAKGDRLEIGEKSRQWPGWIYCINQKGQEGWVPESHIERTGEFGVALFSYDATELNVKTGDKLLVGREEGGWCWCETESGRKGWVPARNLRFD